MLNEAYSKVEYRLDKDGFDSVPSLIRFYVGNRKPVSQVGLLVIYFPQFLSFIYLILFFCGTVKSIFSIYLNVGCGSYHLPANQQVAPSALYGRKVRPVG